MYAAVRFALLLSLLSLLLTGCRRSGLNGDWDFYTALTPDKTGTMTFANNDFSVRTAGLSSAGKFSIAMSGTFQVVGNIISLTPDAKSQGLGGKPGEAMDFKLEWQGDNLAYMSYDKDGVQYTFAICRNGAKPDGNRISLAFDTSKMPASQQGKWKVEKVEGPNTSTEGDYKATPLPQPAQPQQVQTAPSSDPQTTTAPPFSASTQTPQQPDPNQQPPAQPAPTQPTPDPTPVDPNPPTGNGG